MIRVCEPWLHTRLNTVYACIHLDLALPPRTRPRHGAPPEGEGPARRLQGAGGESGTPTRTAPTARTTSSTWPSRARVASCEARGSEGGRAQRGCGCTRYRGGGVSGLYAHYSRFRGRLSAYISCIIYTYVAADCIQVHTYTDTDTDRVPSHTSGRDRLDDQHCLVIQPDLFSERVRREPRAMLSRCILLFMLFMQLARSTLVGP